jgi:uncharacterized membrane protein
MMTTDPPRSTQARSSRRRPLLTGVIISLFVLVSLGFLIATPGGCLTKADMVAYAVCHRIGSHSFHVGGRQLPLCARCTGTFLGGLVGFLGQALVLRRRRAGEFPPTYILVILVGFIGLMGADGLNSYLTFFPNAPHLYEPRNWLRLTTGALNGLAMSALVYPVFNFTLWREPRRQRTIRHLGELGVLLLLEAGMVGLVLTGWGPLLYPLALLSAAGVLAMLTSVNTMIVLMLIGRENVAESWRDALVPLLAGLTVSLVQIGVIDFVRYTLTGTLAGIPPLG